MTSLVTFWVPPYLVLNSEFNPLCRVQARSSVREKIDPLTGGNGFAVSKIDVVKKKQEVEKEAKTKDWSVKDFHDCSRDRPDGGPPLWFCPVESGQPLNNSSVLLFLPGLDGTGSGLILHHKALGRWVFMCHLFWDLVKFAEKTVKAEYASSPHKPIHLVGDSFGGCLALAVAVCNTTIDLVVLLTNPATSFGCSQLQPLLPLLEAMPDGLHFMVLYLLSFAMGDPVKMVTVNTDNMLPLRGLADIIPKETLLWKLNLLKSAASYTNSRLNAVNAEVLLLASGKDNMLPSLDEAQRLMNSLKNCREDFNLLTVIKGTNPYRRMTRHDYVLDFLPPSMSEHKVAFNQVVGLFCNASSSALFSTLDDRKIVKGLSRIPSEGPVLLVGYHILMGLELYSLEPLQIFSTIYHILLYPGGVRKALHYKGEEYKLFWLEQPEFVRMAARFGTTVVPFGTVGENDITELVLDYNDLMKIPLINNYIRESRRTIRARIPGRLYYLFGKLIKTSGRYESLADRENANELYLQVKSGIESCIAYFLKKQEEDPHQIYLIELYIGPYILVYMEFRHLSPNNP
ncbi:hypothetical protein ACJRO7_032850 [Eucalyptus globulus]|uniref:Serine aminopeptidase S33 domain-containing protein n=1 Tax=Eucalyptus globulus TaxID=34317 RepID=A0ABD3JM84_EUCGL